MSARAAHKARARQVMGVVVVALAAFVAFATPRAPLSAQRPPETESGALVSRALEHESAGRNREAVEAWRAVIASGAVAPGVLGLERVFSMLGHEDSLLIALDTLLPRYPNERQLRSAQLRTLSTLGHDEEAAAAFRAWHESAPTDVAPFREYARVLLFNNRASAADTVLREAEVALGTTRALTLEVAQMRAALGLWKDAAAAWREAMRQEPYFETSTVFSLTPTPDDEREAVRTELRVAGAPLGATHALALLEVAWGSPRSGWQVLGALAVSDTAVALWKEFAVEVERVQAWATARDALAAVHAARPDADVALRAARAALRADDAVEGLRFARDAAERLPEGGALRDALPLELDALARLGRASEAEAVLARAERVIGREGARGFARTIAWAWIRAGDVARARATLVDAPLDAEDAVAGWLALFEGDLDGARVALRHTDTPGQDVITALALLNRTREPRATGVGTAFLALARGDSARAARGFESAIGEVPEAAPLLLAIAARIETRRGDDGRAGRLWTRVSEEFAEAPEAPEAFLELARASRRRGDLPGARQRLEHLILTYPSSALVPQARRELDTLRTGAAAGAD